MREPVIDALAVALGAMLFLVIMAPSEIAFVILGLALTCAFTAILFTFLVEAACAIAVFIRWLRRKP